ncbi:unnamed protein product [Ilex paraguariensis]|uniref:Uncharacterized protein n=1 Tax=Ilex paraguariensis TaxID=185542 RepID=A0ABC8RUY6_9AQUA
MCISLASVDEVSTAFKTTTSATLEKEIAGVSSDRPVLVEDKLAFLHDLFSTVQTLLNVVLKDELCEMTKLNFNNKVYHALYSFFEGHDLVKLYKDRALEPATCKKCLVAFHHNVDELKLSQDFLKNDLASKESERLEAFLKAKDEEIEKLQEKATNSFIEGFENFQR